MKKIILFLVLPLMVAVSSCSKSDEEKEQSNTIIGKWEIISKETRYDDGSKPSVFAEFPNKNIKYYVVFKDSGKGDIIGEENSTNVFDFTYTDKTVQIKYVGDFDTSKDKVFKIGWGVEASTYTLLSNKLVVATQVPNNPTEPNKKEYFTLERR